MRDNSTERDQSVQRHNSLRPSPINRILVALDASTSSLNALHTAVELAARFKARMLGLFVEDINLLRLAELPFARQISTYFPQPRPLRTPDVELQLRIQAVRIRDRLSRLAGQYGVHWEFQTVRGAVGAEVLAAGASADLVVLGKIGRSLPGMHRSGSTVRTLLMQRRGMTLVLRTRVSFSGTPVVVLYDRSEAAERSLETAVYLSQTHTTPLLVMIVANSSGEAGLLEDNARRQLKDMGDGVVIRRMVKPSIEDLVARIANASNGPVVIPCFQDWLEGEKLCGLVDEIANPVLLIR